MHTYDFKTGKHRILTKNEIKELNDQREKENKNINNSLLIITIISIIIQLFFLFFYPSYVIWNIENIHIFTQIYRFFVVLGSLSFAFLLLNLTKK